MSFSQFVKASAEENIVGTWIFTLNGEVIGNYYRMVFTKDKICKEFVDGKLLFTSTYQIKKDTCGKYWEENRLYLELSDTEDDYMITCFELKDATRESLALVQPSTRVVLSFARAGFTEKADSVYVPDR